MLLSLLRPRAKSLQTPGHSGHACGVLPAVQQNVAARRLLRTEDPRRTPSFCITGDAKAKPRSLLSSPLLVRKKGTTLPGQAALAESSFVPGGFTARRGISGALESPSVGRELSCLKGPLVAPNWGSLGILYWKAVTSPDPRFPVPQTPGAERAVSWLSG